MCDSASIQRLRPYALSRASRRPQPFALRASPAVDSVTSALFVGTVDEHAPADHFVDAGKVIHDVRGDSLRITLAAPLTQCLRAPPVLACIGPIRNGPRPKRRPGRCCRGPAAMPEQVKPNDA